MKQRIIIAISLSCLLIGMLYFVFAYELIIFNLPSRHAPAALQSSVQKKKVTLFYWQRSSWQKEQTELLWPHEKGEALHYLINAWLTLLDDEQVMQKKVTVQSIIIANSGQHALVSFDRTPFDEQQSTHDKWLWLEGLLKTIRESGIKLSHLHPLVHHQQFHDDHLDFSRPWPVHGFSTQATIAH